LTPASGSPTTLGCEQAHDPSTDTYYDADLAGAGYNWRVRSVLPCRSGKNGTVWNIHELKFYSDDCSTQHDPDVVHSSGVTNIHNHEYSAIDGDTSTAWQGKADGDGISGVWFWAHFHEPVAIGCVKLWQCNCIYSTQAILLERQHYLDWVPVGSAVSIAWGEWSTIKLRV
jgi:hypothetical protein